MDAFAPMKTGCGACRSAAGSRARSRARTLSMRCAIAERIRGGFAATGRPAAQLGGIAFKSPDEIERERECLHCQMLELIEDHFAELPAAIGKRSAVIGADVVIDSYEVLDAIARLVADITCYQSIADRQQMIRYLNGGIKLYDGESRQSRRRTVERFPFIHLGAAEAHPAAPGSKRS